MLKNRFFFPVAKRNATARVDKPFRNGGYGTVSHPGLQGANSSRSSGVEKCWVNLTLKYGRLQINCYPQNRPNEEVQDFATPHFLRDCSL